MGCRPLFGARASMWSAREVLVFEEFHISENKFPMAEGRVHVERFCAFGCATLDDAAATLLAGWLVTVTSDNVPHELHLRDCAVTTAGFKDIMQTLVKNDTFPGGGGEVPWQRPQ